MKNLKIGDIKKFHYVQGNRDFVGVVTDIDKYYVYTINIGGKESRWDFYRNELTYTATRLDPQTRADLEKIAEIRKRINKINSDVEKLKLLKQKELENLEKEKENMLHNLGSLSLRELPEVFKQILNKYHPNLCANLFEKYQLDCYDTPVGAWIAFDRYEYFEKWVSEKDYDFLMREYDGVLLIRSRTNKYKELCNKHSVKDIKFTMSDLQGQFKNEQELQVGDKGSLCYHNHIAINIPKDCMTKVYLEKLVKTIKY